MSSLRQELAAILMDYTDKIPEHTYMEILYRLGEIPDHKDPMKASELLSQLEKERELREMAEDEKEVIMEELEEDRDYIHFLEKRMKVISEILSSTVKYVDKFDYEKKEKEKESDDVIENRDVDKEWICPYCTFINTCDTDQCYICLGEYNHDTLFMPKINKIYHHNKKYIHHIPKLDLYSDIDKLSSSLLKIITLNNYSIYNNITKLLLHENYGWFIVKYGRKEIHTKQMYINEQKRTSILDKSNIRNNRRFSIIRNTLL